MAKGVKQIAMNLSGGGISDTHVGNTSFKRPQYATLGETAPIISFISCNMRQIAFNLQSGGGNNNNLQPQQSGAMQHPPTKDHTAQDSIFSNMRQIGFNKPKRGGILHV